MNLRHTIFFFAVLHAVPKETWVPAKDGSTAPECDATCEERRRQNTPDLVGKGQVRPLGMGLDPGAPQASAIPSGVTPAFGARPENDGDFRFDIRGFLQLPLRVGVGQREDVRAGQKTTVLHNTHYGLELVPRVELGVHGIWAFAQDDRATTATQCDGSIAVYGVDLRLPIRRFGHLYLGFAQTQAESARSVASVIRVLNAGGGLGLIQEYLGMNSAGTGGLSTWGAEYTVSLRGLLSDSRGLGERDRDLLLTAFTLGTAVESSDPVED